MNLVQINERLKDMPVQALQQYANGSNPSIPPYLALAEIQRREKLKQQMANEQGAANAQMPSVKEQIEQKAGLMGLQQAQLQQQQQQMMQPRPGPVPAGAPQPAAQPEAEEAAMASGGIARIPVRDDMYRFADGGIIAFQQGGQSPRVITIPRGTSQEEIDRIRQENPDAVLRPEADIPTAPQEAPQIQRPAQPGMPERSPLMARALQAVDQMPEKPTAESTVAGINALLPQELQDAARQQRAAAAKQRMEEAARAYQQSKPSGLDELIKVFGQSGQYKGLSGLAPAYTRNREQEVARDAAFRKEQEEMRTKAEGQQLKEAGELFGARAKDYSGQMESYRRQLASRSEALANLAGADQRSIDAALGRMNDTKLTELRIAAEKANALRPGEGERVTAQILKLRSQGKDKEAQALLDTYTQVKIGAGGAGMENAQTRANRLAYESLVKELEGMDPKDPMYKEFERRKRELLKKMTADFGDKGDAKSGEVDKTNPLLQ